MPNIVYLSDLLGAPVRGDAGEVVGRLKDMVVRLGTEAFPPLTGLVVSVGGRGAYGFFVPMQYVGELNAAGIQLTTSVVDMRPFARRDGEALLNKDVLDKQIVDINGRRVIRVNDITLAQSDTGWRLAGVDVSMAALLLRLGLGPLGRRLEREVIPWDAVQFFASEVPGVKIKLKYDQLAKLHPMDIAEIINALGYRQGTEVIAALNDALAADVVEGVDPTLQTAVIGTMPVEEAADILEEMAPDDAADLLAGLPEDHAEDLLEEMDPEEAAEVKRLLEYQRDCAGGLMTTEYIAVPQDLTAAQVLDRMRSAPWLPDVIYYVYVLDSERGGKLVGVVTLRDLILARPEARVLDFMKHDLISGHIDESADEVARKIAHYNLIALPIVGDRGRLRGIVTVDDAMDQILPADWQQRMPRVFR